MSANYGTGLTQPISIRIAKIGNHVCKLWNRFNPNKKE
jgi:hypothetical protein